MKIGRSPILPTKFHICFNCNGGSKRRLNHRIVGPNGKRRRKRRRRVIWKSILVRVIWTSGPIASSSATSMITLLFFYFSFLFFSLFLFSGIEPLTSYFVRVIWTPGPSKFFSFLFFFFRVSNPWLHILSELYGPLGLLPVVVTTTSIVSPKPPRKLIIPNKILLRRGLGKSKSTRQKSWIGPMLLSIYGFSACCTSSISLIALRWDFALAHSGQSCPRRYIGYIFVTPVHILWTGILLGSNWTQVSGY